MRLTTSLVLFFIVIDVTCGTLNSVFSTSTYDVIPDRKIDAIYVGTTTLATHNRSTLTIVGCAGICEDAPGCGGFNFCELSEDRTCEAVATSQAPLDMSSLRWAVGCFYFHKALGQCQNGGVMENSTCLCPRGYTNTYCEDHVQGCADVYYQGYRDKDMMMIQPHRNIAAFKVECRLHEGPVTRILKREQGETDFFEENIPMNFYHYKNGRYYPWNGNAWIGLDKLHSILMNSPYNNTAKVTVIFQNNTMEYTGYYGNFFVDSEENSYILTYTNFSAGEYPLDDGFSGSGQNDSANGQPFCPSSWSSDCGICSNSTISGGWFGSGCYYVNPLTVLGELVWPNASVLLPVDKLYIDIMTNIRVRDPFT